MFVKTADYRSPNVAQDFVNTLKETGFGVLSHHPIPWDLVLSVYDEWKQFYESNDKMGYAFDPNSTRQGGYFPFKSENAKGYSARDLKEFYHYRDLGDLPAGMSDKTQQLFERMNTLAEEVLRWLHQALPAEVQANLSYPLPDMIKNSDMSLVRTLHYPPISTDEEEGCIRAAAHGDIDLITVLPASLESGLQVLDAQGCWHDVPCDPGTLVFNAGDMLEMATKGFYPSTTHRVVNPVGEAARKSRYSMPFFLHPRQDVRLSETHTAKQYLDERLREIGLQKVA